MTADICYKRQDRTTTTQTTTFAKRTKKRTK